MENYRKKCADDAKCEYTGPGGDTDDTGCDLISFGWLNTTNAKPFEVLRKFRRTIRVLRVHLNTVESQVFWYNVIEEQGARTRGRFLLF